MERLSSTLNLLKNTSALLSQTNYLSRTPLKKVQRPRDYFGTKRWRIIGKIYSAGGLVMKHQTSHLGRINIALSL